MEGEVAIVLAEMQLGELVLEVLHKGGTLYPPQTLRQQMIVVVEEELLPDPGIEIEVKGDDQSINGTRISLTGGHLLTVKELSYPTNRGASGQLVVIRKVKVKGQSEVFLKLRDLSILSISEKLIKH